MIEVQSKACSTCIYKKTSGFDIAHLESQVKDKHGFFKGYRECHHAKRRSGVCCRGFWNRHKDAFQLGQIAQRLKRVVFVAVDYLEKKKHGKKNRPKVERQPKSKDSLRPYVSDVCGEKNGSQNDETL